MTEPGTPPSAGAEEALFAALVKADRSETFGPVAGDLAHKLSEQLTTILGAISLAKDAGDRSGPAEAEKAALAARDLAGRLRRYIELKISRQKTISQLHASMNTWIHSQNKIHTIPL